MWRLGQLRTREAATKTLSLFNWNAQIRESKPKERRGEERRGEERVLRTAFVFHESVT
jgi:hypothetical protein